MTEHRWHFHEEGGLGGGGGGGKGSGAGGGGAVDRKVETDAVNRHKT